MGGSTLQNILNDFNPLMEMMDFETSLYQQPLTHGMKGYEFDIHGKNFNVTFFPVSVSPKYVPEEAIDIDPKAVSYMVGFIDTSIMNDSPTGRGDAPLVFSMVHKAIIKFFSENDIDVLWFGSRKSKNKLYDHLSILLAKSLGWQLETYDNPEEGRIWILINPHD